MSFAGKGSYPLLKFDKSEKGDLAPEGLARIKALPPGGQVCPVIFIGDGRGGKSYLASRLVGDEEAFVSSDSAEPVTEGIDICIVPLAKLLADVGLPLPKGGETGVEDQHLLVLDCEGGNNAMAAIRTLVNVFGIVIGPQVCFVASGMASEQALQNLGASLAASSLINLDGAKMPARQLHFVVNKNTLQYKEDALQTMLDKGDLDEARLEVRQSIKDNFLDRDFHAIPMKGMPNFEECIQKFRKAMLANRKILTLGDTPVQGQALVGLLELIVKEIRSSNTVSFPSMHRYVILDGFLLPTAHSLAEEYEANLPQLDDYDSNLESRNNKDACVNKYTDTVSYIGHTTLVNEAKQVLINMLDGSWDTVVKKNKALGDQVKEMQSETREVSAESKMGAIGGRGLLKNVVVTMQKMRVESRAVIIRKRGGDPELGPWMDTGSCTTRIQESAFETYALLPVLRGKLQKRSPNVIRAIFGKTQERSCLLKDGHFLWWSAEKVQSKGEASGCINFLIHRAAVCKDPANPGTFIIKPAQESGWSDASSFSGGEHRQFMFDAGECEVTVDDWVKGIEQHIKFANQAYQQLGEDKIINQVGIFKPTMNQVDGTG